MKNQKWTLFIGLVFILSACSDDFDEHVQIRVRNTGPFNYDNLVASSDGSGEVMFGAISSNQTSEYKPFKFSYQYALIQLSIDGTEYRYVPDCYTGEEKLKRGKYTYEVTMDANKRMGFKLVRD